jgi:uncharacterized protein with PIN domain
MASNYLRCGRCNDCIFRDKDQNLRDTLEEKYGTPDGDTWTVKIYCPECIEELDRRIKENEAIRVKE